MDVEPPPVEKKVKNPLEQDPDEDEDLFKSAINIEENENEDKHENENEDLFKSAINENKDKNENVDSVSSSGYQTEEQNNKMEHSDTLEDIESAMTSPAKRDHPLQEEEEVKQEKEQEQGEEEEEEDIDELFKSARGLEPLGEPEKSKTISPPADTEIVLDDDENDEEEERPFQNAHLNPDLQLSGTEIVGSAAATLPGSIPTLPPNSASSGGTTANGYKAGNDKNYNLEEEKELESNDEFIDIKIAEPHKIGEGMSSYVGFKVVTSTNANFFRKKEMAVTRRFSDFLGLHDKLAEKYLPNGRIIPPAPDKDLVSSTKMKMAAVDSNESETTTQAAAIQVEFLEKRRASLQRFLVRLSAHPIFRTDPDFREFLELESDLPKANQTAALSGKSVMKLINKVGDKMSSITLKMEETDDWFEEKTAVIDQLDVQLRKLHNSCDILYEYRRALSVHTGQLAKSFTLLGNSEENSELSGALAQLSSVQEKIESVHKEQARQDFFQLSELIKDYVGLVAAVKDVLNERTKAWQHWQTATTSLTKKRESKVKAELQHRDDRVMAIRQEIQDAEHQQEMAQENFEKISRLIKKEVDMFDVQRCKDFKRNLVLYLESMAHAQDEISVHWERYLPEIQRVSPKPTTKM